MHPLQAKSAPKDCDRTTFSIVQTSGQVHQSDVQESTIPAIDRIERSNDGFHSDDAKARERIAPTLLISGGVLLNLASASGAERNDEQIVFGLHQLAQFPV